MMFDKLDKGSVSKVEGKIAKKWNKMNILEKSIENRKDRETILSQNVFKFTMFYFGKKKLPLGIASFLIQLYPYYQ